MRNPTPIKSIRSPVRLTSAHAAPALVRWMKDEQETREEIMNDVLATIGYLTRNQEHNVGCLLTEMQRKVESILRDATELQGKIKESIEQKIVDGRLLEPHFSTPLRFIEGNARDFRQMCAELDACGKTTQMLREIVATQK